MKTSFLLTILLGASWVTPWAQDSQPPQLVPRLNAPAPNASQTASAQGQLTSAAAANCKEEDDHLPPKVAWTVLPPRVVRDNYGHHVSGNYLAIDVTVHNNNCSTQLVVKTFVFENLKEEDPDLTTDPDLVKGSIAKGHELGARNRIVNGIKTLGLIGTGASGYFKAATASASYNRGLAIFSDPFEKGVELIFPDTTVNYLKNWGDNEVFKDGFTVAAHSDTRGRVFMPIDYVCQKINAPASECSAAHYGKGAKYNPAALKQALGRMKPFGFEAVVAVGRSIPTSAGGAD